MPKKLLGSKSIILFRFYKDFEIAKERIRILKFFDPSVPVYGLYGGEPGELGKAVKTLSDSMDNIWHFKSSKSPDWKWFHTDLMQKEWFRSFGHKLDFDFIFSYEYDLLTCDSLLNLYPDIDDNTLALSAVELLDKVEATWNWTFKENHRSNFLKFCQYMNKEHGLKRQKYVCLGPGPLLPRRFIEKFASVADTDLVHEEITYPAYAEAFGFKLVDHGMHPGFARGRDRLFNCNGIVPSLDEIYEQLELPSGRRSFHPVKFRVDLDEVIDHVYSKSA